MRSDLQPAADALERPAPRPRRSPRGPLVDISVPLVTFAVLFALWEAAVEIFDIPRFVLAAPTEFLPRFVQERGILFDASVVTAQEVVIGFGLAVVVSVPLALVIALSRPIERAIYPVIVYFQIIPKIAVAPLLLVWFGFGMGSKIVLTLVVCFFPILVDSATGFKALDERLLYLTRSMGATPLQTLRYVRLPAALPFIFSGLKVSVVFATTAAIVGEFIGANSGLGYLLLRGSGNLDLALVFAVLLAMSMLGLALSYAVSGLEWLAMPWHRRRAHR